MDEYVILKAIGKGSYGEVHLIQHKMERKQYVVKKMVLNKASKRERKAALLEAKLLSKLKHPNIVSYKDSFENEDGYLYIVMGYAEGGDLYTKLREQREKSEFLSEVQVVRWFIQICMALQYLHSQHILHRDLKTQNIFLTKTKMIKVGDLGIARVLEGATDMATTLIGTPYYMSPELFSNKPYSYKSDVWSLGCCVYEMTTLKHAFNAKDMNSLVYKILKKKLPKMPEVYSSDLCEIMKSMLHQSADKRPSVSRILRHSFIKQHIQRFLDESSKSRRPTSGKSRRVSEASSRRTSTSSVQSRCSSRESNSSVIDKNLPKPAAAKDTPKSQAVYCPRKPQDAVSTNKQPPIYASVSKVRQPNSSNVDSDSANKIDQAQTEAAHKQAEAKEIYHYLPPVDLQKAGDGAAINSTNEVAKRSADSALPTDSPSIPVVSIKEQNDNRVVSASSTASSSSEEIIQKQGDVSRPLPSQNKYSRNKSPSTGAEKKDSLTGSQESVSRTPGGVRVSSARERRRLEKQRQANQKEEVVKNQPFSIVEVDAEPVASKENDSIVPEDEQSKRKESSGAEEISQFYTLLHTTLKLKEEDSPPVTPPEEAIREREPPTVPKENQRTNLTPVEELSESAASTLTSESPNVKKESPPQDSRPKIAPEATKVSLPSNPIQISPSRIISQGTLSSTGRLMDRIVALRKDCIQGLGVPLLHRAYELLDGNYEEEHLEKNLIELLGEVRFKQWAGKIWQLKFCEESIFKHCGSITAY